MIQGKSDMETRLMKALDELFSDGGVHPVVYQTALPDNTLSGPIVEQTLQRCPKCVKALFEVSQAYFEIKNADAAGKK